MYRFIRFHDIVVVAFGSLQEYTKHYRCMYISIRPLVDFFYSIY